MEPTRCTVNGKPGRVKRIRLRDDGSTVAHVRLDDGPLLVVPVDAIVVGSTGQATASKAVEASTDDGPETDGEATGDD